MTMTTATLPLAIDAREDAPAVQSAVESLSEGLGGDRWWHAAAFTRISVCKVYSRIMLPDLPTPLSRQRAPKPGSQPLDMFCEFISLR